MTLLATRDHPRLRRLTVRLGVLAALSLAALLAVAAPASAHAILVASSPSEGAQLASAPTQVSLTFSEPVEITLGALRVFGPDGQRVDTGSPRHGAGGDATVTVGVRSGLPHGTYTVAWRVVSADSHPVHGAFTFAVDAPTGHGVAARAGQEGSPVVGVLFAVVRAVAFAGFALLVGSVVFLLWCWPGGVGVPAARRLVVVGCSTLLGASVGALLLQGPYGAGLGLGRIVDPATVAATVDTRLGTALVIRILLLIATGGYLGWLFARLARADRREQAALGVCGALLVVGLAATWATAGHAGVGSQVALAVPVDVLHLLAMATWVGGLIMLAGVLLRGPDTSAAGLALPRFSRIAFGCVVVLVATGAYQTWRQVGTLPALTSTPYGRLLLAKIAGVAVLIALGARARAWVQQRYSAPPSTAPGLGGLAAPRRPEAAGLALGARPGSARGRTHNTEKPPSRSQAMLPGPGRETGDTAIRRLRLSVAAEVGVAVLVLVLTAGLVNAEPARTAYAAPVSRTAAFDTGQLRGTVNVVVDPARTGVNALHLYVLDASGAQLTLAEAQAAFTLPAEELGPLRVRLFNAGPGHYLSTDAILPMPGTWRLYVTVRTSDIDQAIVTVPVDIR